MNEITFISEFSGTRHFTLGVGEYIVGRERKAAIHIDDPSISRHHARITIAEEEIWVEDLGSSNGCFVDEARIAGMTKVLPGQIVKLGKVVMRISRSGAVGTNKEEQTYKIGNRVGTGGMGVIHEAHQVVMKRDVAMKILLRQGDARSTQRFIHEARITGRLEHPNIIPVHEIGTDEKGRVFYTMKYVRGKTLGDLLAEMKAMAAEDRASPHSLARLLTIYQKVCDAMAFAHSNGVIHRDLKPDNIMIGDFGEVLVMDWGLAKDLHASKSGAMEDPVPTGGAGSTIEGSVLGTPTYMSPEQARGEIREMDERSDIYALGAILHEILYLAPPVSGANALEVVSKVAQGERDRLGKKRLRHLPDGRVPLSLRAVRRKALAFEPEKRYQTVAELQADIAAYQSGFATGAEGAGAITHFALFVKRNKGVARAVAAAVVVLTALTIWFTVHLVGERNTAERAHIIAEEARQKAEGVLALAEEGMLAANEERDEVIRALGEIEARLEEAIDERDKARAALADTTPVDPLVDPPVGPGNAGGGDDGTETPPTPAPIDPHVLALIAGLAQFTAQPGWSDNRISRLDDDDGFALDLSGLELAGLTLAPEIKVTHLTIGDTTEPPDLELLRDLPITALTMTGNDDWRDINLGPLASMPLKSLTISNVRRLDISPLAQIPLDHLVFDRAKVLNILPLRQIPLTRLYFKNGSTVLNNDYSAIGDLQRLVRLELPYSAHGINFSNLGELTGIRHDRFQHGVFMEPREYIHLADLSDEAWRQWGPQLQRLGHNDMHAGRITARQALTFDLDLRGDYRSYPPDGLNHMPRNRDSLPGRHTSLGRINLIHLRTMPVHRLYLDAFTPSVEIAALRLAGNLRHLVLEYAPPHRLYPAIANLDLESITISQETHPEDIRELAKHASLQHVGYFLDPKTRLPTTTREEFFMARQRLRGEHPWNPRTLQHRFDNFQTTAEEWKLHDDKGTVDAMWVADPTAYGGRGGGHLSHVATTPRNGIPYYQAPAKFERIMQQLYRGCIEFELRQSHNGEFEEAPDIILSNGNMTLVRAFEHRPIDRWMPFVIPIMEDGKWKISDLNGPAATQAHLDNVLRGLKIVRIRADFGTEPISPERQPAYSNLDDFRVWGSNDTQARIQYAAATWKNHNDTQTTE